MNNKETIFHATLELASEKGLGNVSLSQTAKNAGIQKFSLYSHFSSKEELIDGLYLYLRESASKVSGNGSIDYGKLVDGQNVSNISRLRYGGLVIAIDVCWCYRCRCCSTGILWYSKTIQLVCGSWFQCSAWDMSF